MAFEVELINVNPRGAVTVTVDGDRHEVAKDGLLTVTPESAGQAPHWRTMTVADDQVLRDNPEALHWRLRAGHGEVFDVGSGLLAQTENWRRSGDSEDPADPLADGRGGQLDPAEQRTMLIDAQRAADNAPADDDTETENI